MSFMQSLECRGLLIQLIILAFDLADDGRNDLLLALKGHKLVSEIRKLGLWDCRKLLISRMPNFTSRRLLTFWCTNECFAFIIAIG